MDDDDLLVRRPQLLVAGFELLDHRLEVLARRRESVPERLFGRGVRGSFRRDAVDLDGHDALVEQHREEAGVGERDVERDHVDLDGVVRLACAVRHDGRACALAGGAGFVDRASERDAKLFACHPQEVQRCDAGGRLEVRGHLAAELNDGEIVPHDDAHRGDGREDRSVGFLADVTGVHRAVIPRRGNRRRRPSAPITEVERRADGSRCARIDLVPRVGGREPGERTDGLGGAEDEIPRLGQRVVEHREDALLDRRGEIDHQVPAADDIHLREGRVARDVVRREDTSIAHVLRDFVTALGPAKEPRQTPRRDVLNDALGVQAGARAIDRPAADVCAEDLEGHRRAGVAERLDEANRDRVDLFAARAAGNPHTERHVRASSGDQAGEDLAPERLPDCRVAEEARDVNEHFFGKRVDLRWLGGDEVGVGSQAGRAPKDAATLDAPPERRGLVVCEVDPRCLADGGEDPAEGGLVLDDVVFLAPRWSRTDPGDLDGDLLDGEYEVHASCRDGALWHALVLRPLLGERDPPSALMLAIPREPSAPMPESTTPMARP